MKFRLFLMVFAVMLAVGAYAAEGSKAPPALPDYTKASYTKYEFDRPGGRLPRLRPELGALLVDIYSDTHPTHTQKTNYIGVFKDKDGKPFYAEWISMSENKIVRGYDRTDDKWVFAKEEPW